MPAQPAKSIFQSKTLWINVILTAVAILELANISNLPIPEGAGPWILFAVGVLNILLRLITTQPVSVTGENQR